MPTEEALPDHYRPDDPDRALAHLKEGWDMVWAREIGRDAPQQPTHAGVVWALVEEAVEVVDRLPDRDKSYLRVSGHAAGFDGNGLTRKELLALEQLRYLSSMMPHDGPTARVLDRNQAARAVDVMTWFRWVGVHVKAKDPRRMVRAAVALARGGDCEPFHRIWRPGSKPHRQAVKNFRQQFTGHILVGLERDLGIVPVCGGDFARLSVLDRENQPVTVSEATADAA